MTNFKTPDITILKKLTALRLDVSIWTARRKLTAMDFGSNLLPPEKLASLGSKKVCNPDDLKIFAALKARATSLLERNGIRFLGGWAIPEEKTSLIVKDLEIIGDDFAKAKEEFLSRYDQSIRQWIADNPGWEGMIAGSIVDAESVRARLSFGFQLFRVAPITGKNRDANDYLAREVNGLSQTLFEDVAKVARDIHSKSFEGKTEITRKALSPLKAMQDKLTSLSFIEPRAAPIASLIQGALEIIPTRGGAIYGAHLALLQGLVRLVSDTDAMLAEGQKILDGVDGQAILKEWAESAKDKQDEDSDSNTDRPAASDAHLDSLGLW